MKNIVKTGKHEAVAQVVDEKGNYLPMKINCILFYLKNYPTFDVLGFIFGLNPSKAEENVKKLLPVLKRAQSKLNVLPRRLFKTGDELEEPFENKINLPNSLPTSSETSQYQPSSSSELENLEKNFIDDKSTDEIDKNEIYQIKPVRLIDVTDRSHFRHKNYKKQKKHFSGKHKRHSVKNTVISDIKRRVLFLGRTKPGSLHDYKMFKKEFSPTKDWFSNVKVVVDLGYQGIKKDYSYSKNIYIPHKKPKKYLINPNPSLTQEQKAKNQEISSKRIVVEHAIGFITAFHILSTRFRNRAQNLVDEVIFQVAGLWNLKIN